MFHDDMFHEHQPGAAPGDRFVRAVVYVGVFLAAIVCVCAAGAVVYAATTDSACVESRHDELGALAFAGSYYGGAVSLFVNIVALAGERERRRWCVAALTATVVGIGVGWLAMVNTMCLA